MQSSLNIDKIDHFQIGFVIIIVGIIITIGIINYYFWDDIKYSYGERRYRQGGDIER